MENIESSRIPSPVQTLTENEPKAESHDAGDAPIVQPMSNVRRYSLLAFFCIAQFLDIFNTSSLFSAIPKIREVTNMTDSEATWLISAFQLTFASFLLMSGRISDVYNPNNAFVAGLSLLGVLSIGAGFLHSKIPLIVFRALIGMVGSLPIPSALSLIVYIFPEPDKQAFAIGIFGGFAAMGNILGILIGAFFVQWASWRWVFWFVGIAALSVSAVCVFLLPRVRPKHIRQDRIRSLDIPGVSILTSALILFIFGVTDSAESGWGSARVLAPMIIGIGLAGAFIYWETLVPEDRAAIPPRTWFYPNFGVLVGLALLPYFWWTVVFTIFTLLWQQVYGWSPVKTAVHFLPIGITGFLVAASADALVRKLKINLKWPILVGQAGMLTGTILLAFASSRDRYWSFAFPAFIIGSGGAMLTFVNTNVAIFTVTPPEIAGTIGACFNCALQLGSAVGIAIVTSIESSVESHKAAGFASFAGRRAALWFALAFVAVETISVVIFFNPERKANSAGSGSVTAPDVKESQQGDLSRKPTRKEVV